MTDTPRTHAQITTLLADNAARQISPQDARDWLESERHPIKGGGFDVIAEHQGFGNDAVVDPGPISGSLNYGLASTVLTIAEDWEDTDDGTGLLLSGMYAYASFDRSTPFPAAHGDPSMAAVVGKTTWEPTSAATGSSDAPGVMHGGFFGVDHKGGVPLSFAVGVEGQVLIEAGKGTIYGGLGVKARGALIGSTTDDPGDFTGLEASVYSQRTGGNYDVTLVSIPALQGGGTPANIYGLRIAAQAGASGANYNVLSEGASTKNKFQGRVLVGTPNSAPTDADLDNAQVTAYLDEAGNKLKFRVRYSGGALKTGEVALT